MQVPVVNIMDEFLMPEHFGSSNLSCNSFANEKRFLQKEFAAAEQPYGWSDVSRKTNEYNVITLRRFSSHNQYHLSMLRALRAVQVHTGSYFLDTVFNSSCCSECHGQNVCLIGLPQVPEKFCAAV